MFSARRGGARRWESIWIDACFEDVRPSGTERKAMRNTNTGLNGFQAILEGRQADLIQMLLTPDGIAIEKSADQMDEVRGASERDLAIRNVDREFTALRDVKAALRRVREGGFGICVDCERPISPKRLDAVPWASRCVQCQEAVEQNGDEGQQA